MSSVDTTIKLDLSKEFKLLLATKVNSCGALNCKFNHDYVCNLKEIHINAAYECGLYEVENHDT